MTWHYMTCLDMTWHDMTLHDMSRHDMTWHDMTWHDMTWHDMTWHDMTCLDNNDMTCLDMPPKYPMHSLSRPTWAGRPTASQLAGAGAETRTVATDGTKAIAAGRCDTPEHIDMQTRRHTDMQTHRHTDRHTERRHADYGMGMQRLWHRGADAAHGQSPY